ncbi:MAG: Sigma-70, region 4 [Pedosphaera sp.]|nr:Sigma-70, region 4 [Pedosphaera sp.]
MAVCEMEMTTKQGELHKVLARLGWTQSELAHRSNIHRSTIDNIISLAKHPTKKEADAIQMALGLAGEYLDVFELWSATFAVPMTGHEREYPPEVQLESLWNHPEAMQLAAPEYENEGLAEAMETVLSRLPKRAYEVLKRRFWKGESRKRIGDVLGVTYSRVRKIESNAFHILKHPAWVRKLGAYMPRHLKPRTFVARHDRNIYSNSYNARRPLKAHRRDED